MMRNFDLLSSVHSVIVIQTHCCGKNTCYFAVVRYGGQPSTAEGETKHHNLNFHGVQKELHLMSKIQAEMTDRDNIPL